MAQLWLRAETYGHPTADTRAPLTPEQAGILIRGGHEVFVEKAPHRVFKDEEYETAGCKMVEPGSWYKDAPADAFILGIKYLPKLERLEKQFPLPHKHIYFAHGWNGDDSGSRIISRLEERDLYSQRPTPFYDLEDLVDGHGKRVAAFGYYAGYAGALLSLHVWCEKELGKKPPYRSPDPDIGREAMVQLVREELARVEDTNGKKPTALVIAPHGRCGKGAVGLLDELGIEYTPWTREQTSKGYPFPEILDNDILLNCVSFHPDNPKFITQADLDKNMKLSVIGDISCYPGPYNPVDIYDDVTSYANLTHTAQGKKSCVDVVAVENLPRLLAPEASVEYSELLFPHIKALLDGADKGQVPEVWQRAAAKSHKILSSASAIKDLGMTISAQCFPKGYQLDEKKADKLLIEWLERNPLSMMDKAGFNRFIADGSAHVLKLRSAGENAETRLKLSSLEEWSYAVDLKSLCSTPRMIAHHSLETEADHFVRSPAGKFVMQTPQLRDAYMKIIDAGHKTLNGDNAAKDVMDRLITDADRIISDMSGHITGNILAGFDGIKALALHPNEQSKKLA